MVMGTDRSASRTCYARQWGTLIIGAPLDMADEATRIANKDSTFSLMRAFVCETSLVIVSLQSCS